MNEPDDFGLSPAQTLAHVTEARPPHRFNFFWRNWRERILGRAPRLADRSDFDASDPTATHEFESAQSVRIGCRLELPGGRVSAGLVLLHGYESPGPLDEQIEQWRELIDKGVAILAIRVRGYPGSTVDCAHVRGGEGWIVHGLEAPIDATTGECAWILSGAVADAALACRALSATLPSGTPVFMHGSSLGGGLAVIATAQLAPIGGAPERVALANPSLGDWPWRLGLAHPLGAGAEIKQHLVTHAELEDGLVETLRLFDAALHAPHVRCPALCKLAERDDVVPAPTAAAVYNALGCSGADRWRYVTKYAHFDGGIADMRRHARFEEAVRCFFDPQTPAEESLFRWVKRRAETLS